MKVACNWTIIVGTPGKFKSVMSPLVKCLMKKHVVDHSRILRMLMKILHRCKVLSNVPGHVDDKPITDVASIIACKGAKVEKGKCKKFNSMPANSFMFDAMGYINGAGKKHNKVAAVVDG